MATLGAFLPILAQGVGMLLGNRFLNKKVKPEELFPEGVGISASDLGMLRSQGLRNISQVNARNLAEINKVGAARRLPSGALASALAGAGYNAARGAAELEPQLKRLQTQINQPYDLMRAKLKIANQQQDNEFFQSGLGNIFKTILLWRAGLLDDAGGLESIGIQAAPDREGSGSVGSKGGTVFGIPYQGRKFQGLSNVPPVSRDVENALLQVAMGLISAGI